MRRLLLLLACLLPVRAQGADRVTFGLDWLAEAEYGGFYQAVATGLYAKHGLEALEKLRELGPLDLALVDWNMPEMNGLEFVQSVRANHSMQNMMLMMVTTETETSQMIAALEAGANEYVMKPFTKDIILDKLCLLGLKQGS